MDFQDSGVLQIPMESWCFCLPFVTSLLLALPSRLSLSSPVPAHTAETLRDSMMSSLQAQHSPKHSKKATFFAAQPPH